MKKTTIISAFLFSLLLIYGNVIAQPTWTLQTSPVTSDLYSCWAVNDQVCWMCGAAASGQSKVIRTTNGGSTWTLVSTSMPGANSLYTIFAFDADNCWAGADDGGLWHTTNGGANWTFFLLNPAPIFINVVHFFDANLGFIQGDPVNQQWRYFITTNGGANWNVPPNAPSSIGTEAGWNNAYCALDTGNIWWGTNVSKILRGSFRGPFASSPTAGSLPYSFCIAFNNANTGVAGMSNSSLGGGPVNVTSNGGVTWTTGSFSPSQAAFGLKSIPGTGYMWMATANSAITAGTIYRSTNSGTSFTSQLVISGFGPLSLSMTSINNGWASGSDGRIWKYFDNVGVNNQNNTPTEFVLKQNYPNPFNPTTTIYFSLAKAGHVTLKVYDMMGKEVETLIDGVESAGEHHVIYNASKLSSGTYFYTMKSGDFKDTKTMVLVK